MTPAYRPLATATRRYRKGMQPGYVPLKERIKPSFDAFNQPRKKPAVKESK